ncbi:MAG: gluconokinase [Pseudomonadota bacterium]
MAGSAKPTRLIVMGVTGCGKSTIGAALAEALDAPFLDGDDYHPPANVAKMSAGQPLTDSDRWPWLDRLGEVLEETVENAGRAVMACSALRRAYRDRLSAACAAPPTFLHLSGSRDLIHRRLTVRSDHFMPPALLESQFSTLEPISPDESALVLPIDGQVAETVDNIIRQLRLSDAHSA